MKKAFLTALTLAVTLSSLSTPALAAKAPPPALTTITTDQNAETFTNSDPNRLVLGDGFGGQGRVIFDYTTGELTFDHCNLDKMLGYHEINCSGLRVTGIETKPSSQTASFSRTWNGSSYAHTASVPTALRDNVVSTQNTNSVAIPYEGGNGGIRVNYSVTNYFQHNPDYYLTKLNDSDLLRIVGAPAIPYFQWTDCNCDPAKTASATPEKMAWVDKIAPRWRNHECFDGYAIVTPVPTAGRDADHFVENSSLLSSTLLQTYNSTSGVSSIIGFDMEKRAVVGTGYLYLPLLGKQIYATEKCYTSINKLTPGSAFSSSYTQSYCTWSISGSFRNMGNMAICQSCSQWYSDLGQMTVDRRENAVTGTCTYRNIPLYVTQTVSQTGTRQVPYNPIVPFSDTRDSTIKSVVFKGCASTISFPRTDTKTVSGYTDTANIWGWMNDVPVTIEGGKYETVNLPAALVTSGNFNSASKFITDGDSTSETANGRTTVKLTNPPIIIDWGEFPGLDIDLSAPTIFLTSSGRGYTMQSKTLCRYFVRMK